jgi:hypothetical protein
MMEADQNDLELARQRLERCGAINIRLAWDILSVEFPFDEGRAAKVMRSLGWQPSRYNPGQWLCPALSAFEAKRQPIMRMVG